MGQEPYGKMFLVHIFLSTRSGANAMLSSSDDIRTTKLWRLVFLRLSLAYDVSVRRSHLCPSLKSSTFSSVITKSFMSSIWRIGLWIWRASYICEYYFEKKRHLMPRKRPLLGLSCLSLLWPPDLHNHLGSSIKFTSCFMRPIESATFRKYRAGLGQCFS